MYVAFVGAFLLSCGLVFAASDDEVHLNLTVSTQMTRTSETIDINYRRKFVKISTPQHDGVQPTELLHDYNQGHNVMKRRGQCYIMNNFDGVPEDIKSWSRMQRDVVSSIDAGDDFRVYAFRVLPYLIDRSPLPAAVQEFCPESLRIVILEEVLDGDDAQAADAFRHGVEPLEEEEGDMEGPRGEESRGSEEEGDNEEDGEYSEIFIPGGVLTQSRVKRGGWWRRAGDWARRHVTVGRGPNGGIRVGFRWRF